MIEVDRLETVAVEVRASVLARCRERAEKDDTSLQEVLWSFLNAYSVPYDLAAALRESRQRDRERAEEAGS